MSSLTRADYITIMATLVAVIQTYQDDEEVQDEAMVKRLRTAVDHMSDDFKEKFP